MNCLSTHKPVTVIIFAKAPEPGFAKTRLIPALGKEGAAELAKQLLNKAVDQAITTRLDVIELCVTPDQHDPFWLGVINETAKLGVTLALTQQTNGNLGERMSAAAKRHIDQGRAVLLMGTDCPPLTTERLLAAASVLQDHDAAMYPVEDGGYSLLGLNQWDPSLFIEIPWSTDVVADMTIQRLATLGWSCWQGDRLWDLDEPADLSRLTPDFQIDTFLRSPS